MKQTTIKVDGKEILIWESDPGESWRMVYDGTTLFALFHATGTTSTKYTLFEGTQIACLNEATRLSLKGTEQFERDFVSQQLKATRKSEQFVSTLLLEITPFLDLAPKLASAVTAATEKTRIVPKP